MGLFKTAAKVAVASSVHGRVQNRQQQRWAQPVQAQPQPMPAAPAPAPQAATPPASSAMDAKLAQLKQLGDLRDAGILSDAEFEVKKHQIMNS